MYQKYCSRICQQNDWEKHAPICAVFKKYHPFVKQLNNGKDVLFDYIRYYRLQFIDRSAAIHISVIESQPLCSHNDPLIAKIRGNVIDETNRSHIPGAFHAEMVCSLINGQPTGNFLGGILPNAIVHFFALPPNIGDVESQLEDQIVAIIEKAVRKSRFINRSGSLSRFYPTEFTNNGRDVVPQHYHRWSQNGLDRIAQTLDDFEAFLILTPGNEGTYPIGSPGPTQYLTDFASHKQLMRRVIIIGNLQPTVKSGSIVSYTAGVMRDHFVLVAGTDIYTIGKNCQLETNTGSSEAAPIFTGIFALFVSALRTTTNALELFKREYTIPIGDAAFYGLGVINMDKIKTFF
jgi:subtilisin family serine protease